VPQHDGGAHPGWQGGEGGPDRLAVNSARQGGRWRRPRTVGEFGDGRRSGGRHLRGRQRKLLLDRLQPADRPPNWTRSPA
jgi:hypothetical protein